MLTAESLPLHISSDQTQIENIWFQSASRAVLCRSVKCWQRTVMYHVTCLRASIFHIYFLLFNLDHQIEKVSLFLDHQMER